MRRMAVVYSIPLFSCVTPLHTYEQTHAHIGGDAARFGLRPGAILPKADIKVRGVRKLKCRCVAAR